jgi:hypothetical protein
MYSLAILRACKECHFRQGALRENLLTKIPTFQVRVNFCPGSSTHFSSFYAFYNLRAVTMSILFYTLLD